MKLSQQDILKLRVPVILLGVVLILMTLLIWLTERHKLEVQARLKTQKNALLQAEQRYQTSGQERDTIIKYLPEYQRLIEIGFIGQEKRLEWVDSLRRVHKDNKLFNIDYSIDPQAGYSTNIVPNLGTFILNRSVMKIEMHMLHEGDLLTLIEQLIAERNSPFIVRDCELTSLGVVKQNTFVPNMLAKCEIDWLTLHEPSRADVTSQ
jgi:hypothetical protein